MVNLSYNDIHINNSLEKVDYVSWSDLRSNCIKALGIKKRWFFQCSALYDTIYTAVGWKPSLEIFLNAEFIDHAPYISPSPHPPSGSLNSDVGGLQNMPFNAK